MQAFVIAKKCLQELLPSVIVPQFGFWDWHSDIAPRCQAMFLWASEKTAETELTGCYIQPTECLLPLLLARNHPPLQPHSKLLDITLHTTVHRQPVHVWFVAFMSP